jgi:hypothetical protein
MRLFAARSCRFLGQVWASRSASVCSALCLDSFCTEYSRLKRDKKAEVETTIMVKFCLFAVVSVLKRHHKIIERERKILRKLGNVCSDLRVMDGSVS